MFMRAACFTNNW